jgi:hypothetical protein
MAFESKRLRVQLPCGDTTVHEHEARRKTPGVGVVFHPTCIPGSMLNPTCGPYGSIRCYWCTYTYDPGTPFGTLCPAIGSPVPDLEQGVEVEVDQLPVVRAELERQLKEIEDQLKEVDVAERVVAEREAEA